MKRLVDPLTTIDAKLWADEFMKVKARLGEPKFDHAMMLGWFANAIMQGYDEGQRRAKADTQATVEALQRERDKAIEAASLPTWVCDGCGRVSSEGWINRVIDSFEGTDYEMECPTCGVRAIEEDCASDLVRERDDLQAALDAEREKVRGLEVALKKVAHMPVDGNGQVYYWEGRDLAKAALGQPVSETYTTMHQQLSQLQALVRELEQPVYVCQGCGRLGRDGWLPTSFTSDELRGSVQCPDCGCIDREKNTARELAAICTKAQSELTQRTAERDTARRRVDELEAREVDVVMLREDLEHRTAELEAATREVDLAEKKAWLAAHDVGFFSMWNGTDYSGPPKLALLCNDTFAWAIADAEDVLDEQIDTIVELFKSEGEAGVIKWIAQQRNMKPMESVGKWLFGCDAIKKERDDLQAELERVRGYLEVARQDVNTLNQLLRDKGLGQGEIDGTKGRA